MSKETFLVAPDEISQTLEKFQPPQLIEVIGGLRPMAAQNSAQAREIFTRNPDLTYAIVQSMLLMGLVDQQVVQDTMLSAAQSTGTGSPISAPAQVVAPVAAPVPVAPVPAPVAAPVAVLTSEQKLAALPVEQQQVIRQVLALTDEQVRMLPADQQSYIQGLREQYK